MDLQVVTEFTPLLSLGGGVLIGLSAVMLMALLGRIAGISGITAQAFGLSPAGESPREDGGWRLAFVGGLILSPLLVMLLTGERVTQTVPDDPSLMALAGLLVGLGAALGSGCTSGHGVCGLARLSKRSAVSVVTFMATGMIVVAVLRHVVGG